MRNIAYLLNVKRKKEMTELKRKSEATIFMYQRGQHGFLIFPIFITDFHINLLQSS